MGFARAFVLVSLLMAVRAAPAAAAPCESLASLSLPFTWITSAATIAPGAFVPPQAPPGDAAAVPFVSLPAFCRVTATLRPTSDSDIRIEVWLPVDGWNGRLQGAGNASWAGVIPYRSLAAAVRGGYAAAGTDAGHVGNTAAFAPGHPERVVDMAHRAVHEMAVRAKGVVAAYYERPPALTIWNGCSTGGRQGITAAVRYPEDFDAVIAGAPAVNWMRLHAGRLALHRAVRRTPAHAIPPAKYPAIHAAVLAACDRLDGVADGVLEDPRACRFDPQELACRGGDTVSCLTAPQVEAARAFYAPVRHPITGEIVMHGLERGSELSWGMLGGPQPHVNALEAFRHVVFQDPKWDWRRFNLALDLDLAERVDGGVLASSDPNLGPFFARGGKLLMYHGWNDSQIPPGHTIDFFHRVLDAAGPAASGSSVQLYMVPGMNHCSGGSGATSFNPFAAMDEWLSSGRAPLRITAARAAGGLVERTRPLCPFGQVAAWNGAGSSDDAAAYACVARPALSSGSR